MVHWNFFDANCRVGRSVRWQPGQLESADELLAEMDHYGIAEAMALDSLSRQHHPLDGNRRILEVTAANDRLHPAWSALPHGPRSEQPASDKFLSMMRDHRVGALYLYPNQYRFTLADWCVDALLEPLAEARVPVVIDPVETWSTDAYTSDGTDWNAVVDLCRRWPTLPVMVTEHRIRRGQRKLYKALEACDNLHIETACLWLHRCVEYITETFGARRAIFGSRWPVLGQHMTLATVAAAEISDEDKRLIAGDNWRKLIGWCEPKHPKYEPDAPTDEYVAYGRSGVRPADMWFDDCHGHMDETSAHYHMPNSTIDGVVRDMDRLGVRQCCIFNFTGVYADEQPGNVHVGEAVKRHPDRFVGFTMLNPHRGEALMLEELRRGQAMGHRGVKLIPTYQGYPLDGPNIDVACQWAHDHRQLILNHDWGTPDNMRRLVEEYPNALFITGHTTLAYADIMREHDNLYVCSCPLLSPRKCEEVVETIGADRFMFGSDLMDLPIAWGLGPILFARISREEKALILGGNLRRLLETYSAAPVSCES